MKNEVIVYCVAAYGEKISLCLTAMGYSVVAFCDHSEKLKGVLILGIPVYGYVQCREKFPDAVYVIANSNYGTALEIGEKLEKDGYQRNSTYFISHELEYRGLLSNALYKNGVIKILSEKTVVLFGDSFLCSLFLQWAKAYLKNTKIEICPSEKEIDSYTEKYTAAVWIPLELLIPEERNEGAMMCMFQEHGICSFSRFFMSYLPYCEQNHLFEKGSLVRRDTPDMGKESGVVIKKVLFLKTSSYSGSVFINSVLSKHPQILYLGYTDWGIHIWYIVNVAAGICREDLAREIIGWIRKYEGNVEWLGQYEKILERYFMKKECFSQKDIFVGIHLAYYELVHKVFPKEGELIIYMDIHYLMLLRDCMFSWLEGMGFEIVLLEMIRKPYVRLGSIIRYALGENHGKISNSQLLSFIAPFTGEELETGEKKYPLIRLRFEDVKLYPEKILGKLCKLLEIEWSDMLLEPDGEESRYTINRESTVGFDLKPVYRTYDEYFDAFDKFRLDLIFREKNRAYGYSYVEREKYPLSLEELGKLFELPFCFERFISFRDEDERRRYHKKMRMLAEELLYFEEEKEKYAAHFQFGKYLGCEEENS